MSSAFADITEAFIESLNAKPPVCAMIFRARDRQVPDGAAAALNVQFDGAVPDRGVIKGAPVDWLSRYTIECFARSVGSSPDVAVDSLMQAVYERLAGDSTLGGVVDDLGEPVIEAEYSAEGKRTGWVSLTYTVQHRTANLKMRQS